jgi:hypothetical protein
VIGRELADEAESGKPVDENRIVQTDAVVSDNCVAHTELYVFGLHKQHRVV